MNLGNLVENIYNGNISINTETENKLLNKYFGYKNIDELVVAFNNIKTDEELDKFFDKIDNSLTLLKKLINTVSDITEKK